MLDLEASSVVLLRPGGVDPRVLVLRAGDEVDGFAVLSERFVLLLDTFSTPELARQALDLLRPLLAGRPLVVLNTHADLDHAWGNRVFAAGGDWPSPIIGHREAAARLTGETERAKLERQQGANPRYANVRLVPPSILVGDHLRLAGGDLSLDLLHTPGHTQDHLAVWLPELRTLLAGDAAEFPFPHVQGGANLPKLRASLRRLIALDPLTVLACHGQTTQADLPGLNLAYFDRIEAAVRAVEPLDAGADDLPQRIGFTYPEALAWLGADPERTAPFYADFHADAVRAMTEWVQAGGGAH